jgi:hypothetical protein
MTAYLLILLWLWITGLSVSVSNMTLYDQVFKNVHHVEAPGSGFWWLADLASLAGINAKASILTSCQADLYKG